MRLDAARSLVALAPFDRPPLQAGGVVGDRLAEVDRLQIRKKTAAERRRQKANEEIPLDLEGLGGDLPLSPGEGLPDQIAERSEIDDAGALTSLIEREIPALAR